MFPVVAELIFAFAFASLVANGRPACTIAAAAACTTVSGQRAFHTSAYECTRGKSITTYVYHDGSGFRRFSYFPIPLLDQGLMIDMGREHIWIGTCFFRQTVDPGVVDAADNDRMPDRPPRSLS